MSNLASPWVHLWTEERKMKMKDLRIGMQVKLDTVWPVTVEAIVPKHGAVLIFFESSATWGVVEPKDLTPLPVARTKELLQLADLLEKDAKTPTGLKFDMKTFGMINKKDKPEMNCGTTACAWGSAAISGIFKRQGVSYQVTSPSKYSDMMQIEVTYKNSTDFHAAEKFFNISLHEVEYLFHPGCYPASMTTGAKAERYVAKRIRNFVDYKLKGTKSRYYKETIKDLERGVRLER